MSRRTLVGQVPDLPILKFLTRTRPRPFLGSLHQPSTHRISLDVSHDVLKLPIIAHPVVVGFILPKRLPGGAKNAVSLPGARALYGSGYFAQWLVRTQENVHVVRHHYPSGKVTQLPLLVGCEQSVDHSDGNAWVRQPHRTRKRPVQFLVEQCETPAFGGRKVLRTHVTFARNGAVESPCQKDRNAFGLPVRQSTTIEADGKLVLTRAVNSHYVRSGTWPTPGRSETWPTSGRSETCPTL